MVVLAIDYAGQKRNLRHYVCLVSAWSHERPIKTVSDLKTCISNMYFDGDQFCIKCQCDANQAVYWKENYSDIYNLFTFFFFLKKDTHTLFFQKLGKCHILNVTLAVAISAYSISTCKAEAGDCELETRWGYLGDEIYFDLYRETLF